jgi:hypothetical protein
MNRTRSMLFTLSCLVAAPLVAQTQIGGGTCNSSTLSGIYAFTITGRQVKQLQIICTHLCLGHSGSLWTSPEESIRYKAQVVASSGFEQLQIIYTHLCLCGRCAGSAISPNHPKI